VVTDRKSIALEITEIVGEVAGVRSPPLYISSLTLVIKKWGVIVESILIKDISFTPAEVNSARLMHQAADILASPAAMQIRQLEALQTMEKSAQSKVISVPISFQDGGAQAGPSGSQPTLGGNLGRAAIVASLSKA
jgi:erythrocyte band 7 integral membrane protein